MVAELDIQILTLGLGAVSLLLTATVVLLVARVNRLTQLTAASGPKGRLAPTLEADVQRLRLRLDQVLTDLADVRAKGEGAIRRVGVVRYDAFRDMGGHMSFSVALLDGRDNGLVISILNGRDGSRGYAKAVRQGRSPSPLSTEEQEAMAQALDLTPAP